jgi:uncharacterized protein DUF5615
MSRTIRLHLDENCPRALAVGLRRRGIDVTTTPEAGLLEATDEEQTAYTFRGYQYARWEGTTCDIGMAHSR